jgi:hypothetical protein
MQINRKAGLASNYDCGQCSCPYNYTPAFNYLAPQSEDVPVDSSEGFVFYAGYADCNNNDYYYDYTYSASWSSGNPSIASSLGYGLFRGVSAGNTSVSASYTDSDYTFQGSHCSPYPVNGGASATANVDDGTPGITSVSPVAWPGGATTTVTLGGENFGTNKPGLSVTGVLLDGQSVITSYSNTQVVFSVTVDPTDPGNTASIVVTSNGYNGSGFIAFPGGGSSSNSNAASAKAAVPTNFSMTKAQDDGGGTALILEADFSWKSSTGSLEDLADCDVRENTTYPTGGNNYNGPCPVPNQSMTCYYPPSPPWPVQGSGGSGYPNPTQASGPASAGGFSDLDSSTNLSFVKPYSATSFSATQYYQYTCNGTTWTNIYGPTTITRSMFTNSQGKWAVKVSRSDTTATSTVVILTQ